MCVMYVSFRSKVKPIIFWCVAMGSAVRSSRLLYSSGSGVTRVQVLLSGLSVRLLFCLDKNFM